MEGLFSSSKKIYKKFKSKKVVKRSKKGTRVRGIFKKLSPIFAVNTPIQVRRIFALQKRFAYFFIQKPNNFPDFCPLGERYFFQKADIFRFPLLLSERYFSRKGYKMFIFCPLYERCK